MQREAETGLSGDVPIILSRRYDTAKWILEKIDKFPKDQRFIFGTRLADRTLGILEGLVQASYSGGREKVAAIGYLERNRRLMRYDEYLAAGYPIGSGVAEGACRHLVTDRMERTGMRWRVPGAQAMLDLRAVYINGDWDTLQAYRIKEERRKPYPYLPLLRRKRSRVA